MQVWDPSINCSPILSKQLDCRTWDSSQWYRAIIDANIVLECQIKSIWTIILDKNTTRNIWYCFSFWRVIVVATAVRQWKNVVRMMKRKSTMTQNEVSIMINSCSHSLMSKVTIKSLLWGTSKARNYQIYICLGNQIFPSRFHE